jgi:hypothetical protein
MSELIYTNAGNPFKTEHAAKMTAGRKKFKTEVVAVDGGYAIKKLGDEATLEIPTTEQIVTKPSEPEQEEVATATPDVEVTRPWRPRDANEIPDKYKEDGFVYKLAYKKQRAIDSKLRLGWVIDRKVASKMRKDKLLFEDGSCDSTLIIGDTILMKLPKERAKARRSYYSERTMDGMKRKKEEYDSKLRDCGVKSVGDGISISRGIVA